MLPVRNIIKKSFPNVFKRKYSLLTDENCHICDCIITSMNNEYVIWSETARRGDVEAINAQACRLIGLCACVTHKGFASPCVVPTVVVFSV